MSRFTVKWINDDCGVTREHIYDTDRVEYAVDNRQPNEPSVQAMLGIYGVPRHGIVVIGDPYEGAESMAFAHGKVFVMNAEGKTTAVYHLAPTPPWAESSVHKDQDPAPRAA